MRRHSLVQMADRHARHADRFRVAFRNRDPEARGGFRGRHSHFVCCFFRKEIRRAACIAEAIANSIGRRQIEAFSAGVRPAARVDPIAAELLEHAGLPRARSSAATRAGIQRAGFAAAGFRVHAERHRGRRGATHLAGASDHGALALHGSRAIRRCGRAAPGADPRAHRARTTAACVRQSAGEVAGSHESAGAGRRAGRFASAERAAAPTDLPSDRADIAPMQQAALDSRARTAAADPKLTSGHRSPAAHRGARRGSAAQGAPVPHRAAGRAWAGWRCAPLEALALYEALAGAEASVAWIVWNNALPCFFGRFLRPEARAEIFGNARGDVCRLDASQRPRGRRGRVITASMDAGRWFRAASSPNGWRCAA